MVCVPVCGLSVVEGGGVSDTTSPHVYRAIAEITAALSKSGIAKNRTNTQGSGYKFRGIDDVFNALSPLLAEKQLCIVPRMTAREQVERASKQGGALYYTTVTAEFDFVSAVDGSRHTAITIGEAMDSGDKSTNKAMSAAYKYACFLVFCIPLEGMPDADEQTYETMGRDEGVSESRLTDMLTSIREAEDSDALKAAWTAAYESARCANDRRAIDRLIKAKDERKATLAKKSEAA